jgi:peroxiredoxin Q/BCP
LGDPREIPAEEDVQMIAQVGQVAPRFSLPAHDGSAVSLEDLRGRKVLLWFFPEADTPGCTAEGLGFRDHREYFDEGNIVVVGVSFNSPEENAAFAKKHGFGFPLLSDTGRTTALAYGACEDPKARYADRVSFLIDESGGISRMYDNVNPRDHAARILADFLSPDD